MNKQTAQLLTWYDRERRILPWREDPTPYHIWLSEIMLQQTRVETGKEYYLRFLESLPDIPSLAAAQEETCLKLWEGLGYYSRVRNLHKAAVIVMREYDGRLPETARELERLPGIGPYTAAAIASIAFGQPEIALDGNLLRVFARMNDYEEDIRSAAARDAAQEYYRERMPSGRPGDFNQALMDLGAGVCLPNGAPMCGRCPWSQYCRAHGMHRESACPVTPPKRARRIEKRTVMVLQCGDRVAIRRRPDKGLLAGLYEFPNTQGHLSPEEAAEYVRALPGMDNGEVGPPVRLPNADHIFSHIEWNMIGYRITIPDPNSGESVEDTAAMTVQQGPAEGDVSRICWATREELSSHYSIPTAFEMYRSQL